MSKYNHLAASCTVKDAVKCELKVYNSPMTLVLLNPHARGGRARLVAPAMQRWLAANAPSADWAAPDSLAQAQALIMQRPMASRVIAVGGDGSVNRWLPALLARGHSLGLVPMGSGNDLARALGLYGLDWQTALTKALHDPASPVDTGLLEWDGESTPFLSSLTAGFDAAVGLRALRGPTWLRGQPRYLWATLKELAALRHWPVKVSCNGEDEWSGPVLFASTLNTPSFGSGMPAVPHAQADDGQLDLLLARRMGRLGVLALLPRLLLGKHLSHTLVRTRAFSRMDLHSSVPIPLAADGEYLGQANKLSISIRAASLQIVKNPWGQVLT